MEGFITPFHHPVGIPGLMDIQTEYLEEKYLFIEGALIALICDAEIRNQTKGLKSLHDVMKLLHDYKKVSSYDATTYKDALESVSGTDFTSLFDALIYGAKDFSPYLQRAFAVFGWKYSAIKSENASWLYGFKTQIKNNEVHVISIMKTVLLLKVV